VLYDETGGLGPELARFESEVELFQATRLDAALEQARQHLAHLVVVNASEPQRAAALVERARRAAPGVPVIGCSVPNPVRTAAAAGAAGYVVKPVTRSDLARLLGSVGRPVRRVLVVDDDPDALALFARMLWACDEALEVKTSSSGEDALALAVQCQFDLILLDIVMPGMDGWAVIERLRAASSAGQPLVYFVSAQDPADRPAASDMLLASIGEGVSVVKLLRMALEAATLLLTPDGALDPVPPRVPEAAPAWR
jgi:CheY-like chemotaxis protein